MNQVLDGIDKVVTAISGVLYMPWVPFLLLAAGLFFTFRSKFMQVRLLGESFRVVSEKPKTKGGDKALEKKLRAVERDIEKQEALVAEFEPQIEAAASDYQELTRLFAEKEAAEAQLEALMEQWEQLSLELEA